MKEAGIFDLEKAMKSGELLRDKNGSKVLILADVRQFTDPDQHGFHFVGGYIFQGQFYEARYNEQGQCDRTNHWGTIVGYWG